MGTLYASGLLAHAGSVVSLRASSDFKRVARKARNYREVYDAALNSQQFNLLLDDGAFFQFSLLDNGDIRLAFYPNPYKFIEYMDLKQDAQELLEAKELTIEEYSQILSEADFNADIPTIRYDYSVNQYNDFYHPAAHFHIGYHSENRWPVRKILTPYAFTLKVLRHYYVGLWVGDDKLENFLDLDQEYRQAAMECEEVNSDYFSEEELQRFYFC